MAMKERWKELPEDVIKEIFLRLPVRSLIRFKCVSKTWYFKILSHSFIDRHYATNKHKQVSFYCHSNDSIEGFDIFGIRVIPHDTTFLFRIFDIPVDLTIRDYKERYMQIVGCSRGVVCLCLSSSVDHNLPMFALWNPATRKLRRIGPSFDKGTFDAGFCFNPVENTFKLTRISISFMNGKRTFVAKANTFMSKDYSWTGTSFVLPSLMFRSCDFGVASFATCANRCMYWIIYSYHNGRRNSENNFILSYDMIDETFERIEHPFNGRTSSRLVRYRDTVALIDQSGYDSELEVICFNVWVMDGSGSSTSKSWSKQFTCKSNYDPLGFLTNGDEVNLVVSYGDQKWSCDLETGALVADLGELEFSGLFQYSESLASIYW